MELDLPSVLKGLIALRGNRPIKSSLQHNAVSPLIGRDRVCWKHKEETRDRFGEMCMCTYVTRKPPFVKVRI